MAECTDYVVIISVRVHDRAPYDYIAGDNMFSIFGSKWQLDKWLEEREEEAELNDVIWDDSEIWIFGFKFTWDYDVALGQHWESESETYFFGGDEDAYDKAFEEWSDMYGDEEVFGYARQRASDDNNWWGDPRWIEDHPNLKGIADEIADTLLSGWVDFDNQVSDVTLLPLIEWRIALQGGRSRNVA